MPSQASPVRQSLLKVGVGLSGLINAFCSSAIAAPLATADDTSPKVAQQPSKDLSFENISFENTSSNGRLLPLSTHSSHSHHLSQSLPPLLKGGLISVSTKSLSSADFAEMDVRASEDRLCQILKSCDRDITFNIDATRATAVGDVAISDMASDEAADSDLASSNVASLLEASTVSDAAFLEPARLDLPPSKTSELPSIARESPSVASATAHSSESFERMDLATQQPAPVQTAQRLEETNVETSEDANDANNTKETPSSSDSPERLDDELGTIRAKPIRRDDLGILRLLQTNAPPPPPRRPIGFLSGRLSYINSENALRLDNRLSENIYQSGLAFRAYPSLSKDTSLYAISEASLGRFERNDSRGYNEIEFQVGIRQKVLPRTYAQLGLRNQRFFSRDFGRQILGINYIDTSLSHRSVLDSKTWLDSFYQARLGFADSERSSRFRQTFTLSLNHAISREFRTNILYQLALEDYTQISRYDISHQFIGTLSYRVTPESRITLFGGTRFGNSSGSDPVTSIINLDDTFYGAEVSVNVPLF